MGDALTQLLRLGPDGVQLTPGNQPTADFERQLQGVRTRTHHGYAPRLWKSTVWNEDGTCAVDSDSVHPPRAGRRFALEGGVPVLETMYPGYALGCGAELDAAMDRRLPLAVDVSHVFLQREAGVLSAATWRRLQDYEAVAEVHVSRNAGRLDSHLPLTAETFGLEWALQKLRAGTPVILESYLHRVSPAGRRAQCALFDGART